MSAAVRRHHPVIQMINELDARQPSSDIMTNQVTT